MSRRTMVLAHSRQYVIPSPPVADLESLVATLNAVPDIALAVVSALSYVHLGSDAKGI